MAQKFGNTWWGKEWLRSLTHIDWDNRIPRGAKYARLGYVKEIELTGRTINACVQGSRPAPYKVSITVPPFTAAETGRLVTALMKRPAVISRLLNRELSPEVMDIAQECGLRIFPRRWNDLQMTCNCPDWAVPCKHLAAVIYMFSHEIDNNPFIVFQMHGVDLLEELEKRGVEVDDMHKEIVVPELEKVVQLLKDKELPTELPAFRRIDFSRLSDCSEALLALLSDNPSFAPTGNFKDTYSAAIRHVKKTVQRFFNGKLAAANLFAPVLQPLQNIGVDDELTLHFDSSLCWKVNNIVRGKARPDLYLYDIHTLPVALLRINPDFLLDYHPTVSALYQSLFCALHLLSKGAVTPQLLRMSDQTYTIHWTPACIDPQIRALMDALEDIVPCTLVMTRPTGRKLDKCVARPGRWAVSFFLDMLIKDLSPRCDYQSLAAFFIKGWRHAFNNVGQQEVPGSIKAWTAAYQLAESDYRPVFSVEENPHYGFDLHIGVEDKRQPEPRITALCEILDSPAYEHERYRILHCFMLIRTLIKEMDYYIASGARLPIHYTTRSFIPFLLQVIPVMRMLDIKVFMPKALEKLIRPKATLSLKCKQEREKGFFCLADLFTFDWKVALGNDILSIDEFMKLQQEADGLLKFKQHYIYVDTQALQKLHEAFTKTERLTPAQLLQAALAEEFASAPVYLSDEVRNLIRELTTQQAVPLPVDLNATLRPYQERGFAWMYRNLRIGFGSILADDMGLGKTLQAIALMLKLKEEGKLDKERALIVVPTGLLTNWQAEVSRFAPTLSIHTYHGPGRDLKRFDADILLTTYGVIRSDSAKLKKRSWSVMLIDEAQNIKNHDSAQSKAVRSIPAACHIALSGTPVENRLTELWSIMEYANRGYLDSLNAFKKNYAIPIQFYNDEACATRFRKVTAPFLMRRMKTDKSIIADLPQKIELNDYAALQAGQAALYTQTLEAAMTEIERLDTTDCNEIFKRQGLVLQMILALKQICNHPALFLKNGDYRAELSGKTEMLLDRVESILAGGEKMLIFTQFREMGNMLTRFVEERTGSRPLFYHGGCDIKERQEIVDRFQHNRADRILILTLKAAGTGLNLTAASHVIHYDLWWNPAVEAQATDRAYRIGQHQNVVVHRFITRNTFEERINNMIQQKKHLADMTVASGESWIGQLSNKELREIFG